MHVDRGYLRRERGGWGGRGRERRARQRERIEEVSKSRFLWIQSRFDNEKSNVPDFLLTDKSRLVEWSNLLCICGVV